MNKTISFELPQQGAGIEAGQNDDMPIDFKALVGTFFKRFWMIVISASVVFLSIAFMTLTQTPIYKAEAVIIVDSNQRNVIDLGAVLGGTAMNTSVLDTEVRVIGSKTLLQRVAVKEELLNDPEFNPTLREPKPSLLGSISQQIFGLVSEPKEEVDPFAGMTDEERNAALTEWVVANLMGKVRVSRVGTTYLITIEVTSESAETAARLANAIADQYRVEQMDAKLEATQRATEWLSEKVTVLRDEVSLKENSVEQFRNENGLLIARGDSLTEARIAELERQKLVLQSQATQARARYESMRRQMNSSAGVASIAEVLNSAVVNNLKSQQAIVDRRIAELETEFGPRYPDLIAARNEAIDLDRQMAAEVQRIVDNIEAEVEVAEDQIATLNRQIGQGRGTLIRENTAQVRLRELERDAEASRVIYDDFIERFNQTREQDDLVEADARVLSAASIPSAPSSPRVKLNLAIGLILGGVVGGMLALIFEIFDTKISSTEDIERKLGIASLGSIPLISGSGFLGFGKRNPADFLVENPLSGYTEGIRYLRAAIAFSDIDRDTKSVAITSSLPDEGKTSLTLSLARMSAMSGAKTLVIDGDFRRRQLTEAAGIKTDFGLVEHLFGSGNLDDAIQRDEKSGTDVLPLSLNGHTPHDVFGTRAFDELHKKLRTMYDLILIDTGPLLLMAEARVIAGKVDKTILVARWRRTNRATARKSMALLKTFRANVLGVVLNMVDIDRRRHHNEPGTSYKDYKKYYMTDNKRRLFGGKKKPIGEVGPIPEPATEAFPPRVADLKPVAAVPRPAVRPGDSSMPKDKIKQQAE